jgi:hypothetical protein
MTLLNVLLNAEEPTEFNQAWSEFFLQPARFKEIQPLIQGHLGQDLLKNGQAWVRTGWNTGSASKQLFELVGVPLVSNDFNQYKLAWLYALAMVLGVDVPVLELSDRASDAAFALSGVLSGTAAERGAREEPAPAPGGPETPEDVQMEWDEPSLPLPQELLALWSGVQAGSRKLNLAQLLDNLPKFADLPIRPPRTTSGNKEKVRKTAFCEVTNKRCCTVSECWVQVGVLGKKVTVQPCSIWPGNDFVRCTSSSRMTGRKHPFQGVHRPLVLNILVKMDCQQ